jgi:triacylglycerol esterase/lipase EstA (alpha/beta hydrolase family)
MKILRIILCFAITFLANQISQSQDRPVIWVHGLNDNNTFWANMATVFNAERRMTSSNLNYGTGNGVVNFATQIRNNNIARTSNIVIGHSMGGVALREVNRVNSNFFGGAITFGSPLDGARIVNSWANGSLVHLSKNLQKSLLPGLSLNTAWTLSY